MVKVKTKESKLDLIARNVAEIKETMATKDDIKKLEFKIEDTEKRLSAKIDAVDEKVDGLEEIDVRGLQRRVFVLEKDVRQIKQKHA